MTLASLGSALLASLALLAAPAARAQEAAEAPPAEAPAAAERWGNLPELPVIGAPIPGGVNYQPAASPLAEQVHALSHAVHIVMALIVLFVMALLAIVIVRYNHRANPTPARFTHNTRIEIAWTLVPVLILIGIGSFSLPVLFRQVNVPDADLTIKTTGQQWFWSIEYPDNEIRYESFMLPADELEANGYDRRYFQLATDTAMVVPVDTVVRLQVTASDVIHSWTIPAFATKMDGIPGRLNETWFEATEIGTYFGQCSELCGLEHSFMPITVKVVSREDYEAWLDWAIDEYGGIRPEAEVAAAG